MVTIIETTKTQVEEALASTEDKKDPQADHRTEANIKDLDQDLEDLGVHIKRRTAASNTPTSAANLILIQIKPYLSRKL